MITIVKKAIDKMNLGNLDAKMKEKITDEIFLIIQNDRGLMQEYLRAVEANGLDSLNRGIGKAVKKVFNLIDNGQEKNPRSTLIGSYTKFK